MLNEIDFVVTGDRTKRLTHVTENGFGIIDIKWVDGSRTEKTQRFDYSTIPLGAVIETGLPEPLHTVSHVFGRRGERIKFSLYYYYDSAGKPPLASTIISKKYRYVGKRIHPQYVLWPSGEVQNPLSIRDTLNFAALSNVTAIATTSKTQRLSEWKNRISILANYFDTLDDSLKWAHQSGKTNELIMAPATTNEYSIRLDNVSKHWCKGIGIAWRCINEHETSTYSRYGVPVGIRPDRYNENVSTPINIALGTGIDVLISELEEEYRMIQYLNVEDKQPIRNWYYGTAYATVAGDAYYGGRKWWFTNHQSTTLAGSYVLYTAADAADWEDLWTQYRIARDWT